jgi:glutathione S-transferase
MPDRRSKESAGEQYRRLAQECLEMVPSIQDGEGRDALIEMARVWLRLAERYQHDNSTPSAARQETRPVMQEERQVRPEKDDAKD